MASKAVEAQRRNYHYMADAMRRLEWDLHQTIYAQMRIPPEWHEVAREKGRAKSTRVTIRLDEDVVKFFRSTGEDWQPRVNRVLSSWVHARLAGMIEGAETMDYMRRRVEDDVDFDGPRPQWADGPREMQASGLNGDLAWGPVGDGPGVPMQVPGVEAPRESVMERMLRWRAEGR